MGFRRYAAPTARAALERIRQELGTDAVILSNRRTGPTRVEIIAAAPAQMRALVDELEAGSGIGAAVGAAAPPPTRVASGRAPAPARAPAPRTEPPGTPETFADFIRRQSPSMPAPMQGVALYAQVADPQASELHRAAPVLPASAPPAAAPAVFRRRPQSQHAAPQQLVPEPAHRAGVAATVMRPARGAAAVAPAPAAHPLAAPLAAPDAGAQGAAAAAAPWSDSHLLAELQSLRTALGDRISNIEVRLAGAHTNPALPPADPRPNAGPVAAAAATRRQIMTRLILSGFSPELARRVGDAAPATLALGQTDGWLQQVVSRHLRCPAEVDNPLMGSGALALVGPTGVGKTTTVAKIAARCVVRHGGAALGLITLDTYRLGAHEQLRGYGRILGVPVHAAHDAASLAALLTALHGQRLVLIDTGGMSQRDPRLADVLALLAAARFADQPVRRVLLINAASHAETLDEVARGWQVDQAQGAILTKIDEAARIGGALDALLRFQTPLLGLTNGQRVPEDWHPGNPALLAHIALKPFAAAFTLDSAELQVLARTGASIA